MNCKRVEGSPDPSLANDGEINIRKRKKKKKETLVISGSRHYLNAAYKPHRLNHDVISSYQTLQPNNAKF